MSADAPRVHIAIDGSIATLTLNRADKLNAIDPAMLTELELAIHDLERSRHVRVVLLTGAGDRAFSVGADIDAWSALGPLEMWADWIRNGHRIFERLARLRQPVIAVLNGYTFGGGLELALTADIRLAADHVELALPEVKLGTVPGWAATQRLPALIGAARAKQMIFSGSRVDAATAEHWGLVNEIVPRDSLISRAQALAAEIAANAPHSVQIAKQLIDAASGQAMATALESLASAVAASTEDAREGLAAYHERRPPRFTGSFERPGHSSEEK